MVRRRDFVKAGMAAGAGALVSGGRWPGKAAPAPEQSFQHSVSRWCYSDMELDELCREARRLGIASVELLGPEEWPVVEEHGLTCAMANGPEAMSIEWGFNRREHHEELVPAYHEHIQKVAEAGLPNVICFSGNREGLSDEEGLENCAAGIEEIVPTAEEHGVMLCMELLNSKVDHPDYQCDHTPWGVELVERVGSDHFRLLYDIYHMQIMEGDVIRTIRDNHEHIAHYHTAGVPGRNEIDETQELNYEAIMRAIAETGFDGFVGQEFVPTGDPMTSLEEAIRICSV